MEAAAAPPDDGAAPEHGWTSIYIESVPKQTRANLKVGGKRGADTVEFARALGLQASLTGLSKCQRRETGEYLETDVHNVNFNVDCYSATFLDEQVCGGAGETKTSCASKGKCFFENIPGNQEIIGMGPPKKNKGSTDYINWHPGEYGGWSTDNGNTCEPEANCPMRKEKALHGYSNGEHLTCTLSKAVRVKAGTKKIFSYVDSNAMHQYSQVLSQMAYDTWDATNRADSIRVLINFDGYAMSSFHGAIDCVRVDATPPRVMADPV